MRKWWVGDKMIHDPGFQCVLGQMSGIDTRVSGDAVQDYKLLSELKKELQKQGRNYVLVREKADLGLSYLLLFHPSPLVRHEAAFVIGEYGKPNSFLRSVALLDSDATVRHEAALAMSTEQQRRYVSRNKWALEYIAKKDKSKMVRDTAKVSLDTIEGYVRK